MKTKLNVENMQCGHCVSTINNNLLKINGVFGVEANIAEKSIMVDHTPDVSFEQVKTTLEDLGYSAADIDAFGHKAEDWDKNTVRVELANKFVRSVMELMPIQDDMTLMDFGCGTGLVGLQFAPYVKQLVMVDNSPAMLAVLVKKVAEMELDSVEVVGPSIKASSTDKVDAIVSQMAFHHVEDTKEVLEQMYEKLNPGGFIAIADLAKEDGSFHKEAVPHNGFDEQTLCKEMSDTGFKLHLCEIYNTIQKETEQGIREYQQFLIIAKK